MTTELLLLFLSVFWVAVESCCQPERPNLSDPLQIFHIEFLKDLESRGFEEAFKSNIQAFAEFAESDPQNLSCCIEEWLGAHVSPQLFPNTGEIETVPKILTGLLADNPNRGPISGPLIVDELSGGEIGDKPIGGGPIGGEPIGADPSPGPPIPGVVESDGTPVKVFDSDVFKNWGGTVQNVPRYTFVPKTKVGVINIVKFAKEQKLRVRASGARHSWSDVYGSSDEVLISMLEPDAAVPSSPFGFPSDSPQNTELESLQFNGTFIGDDGVEHGRLRMGGAATTEHYREWALSTKGGNWTWMIRALPILVEITSAGWTQVICHGSGITHKTVSDLVLEVVIVNYEGELQTIRDKELLRAVSGGFGLLGIVVEQVFVLDPLKIADFFPLKVPTVLGVPPVSRSDVPKNDDFSVANVSDAELNDATRRFEQDCLKFYAEWFWFPFQPDVWINAWNTSEPKSSSDRPVYPDAEQIALQKLQSAVARIFEETLLNELPPRTQADLLGFAAMYFLPSGDLIRTSVPDALHFRRGIHLLPVRDSEIELEIPPRADGSSDFSVCQKAWWMAISAVYEALPNAPMRTTLEMRIIGGSDVTLSTQRGNDHGTCSIEVLTTTLIDDDEWAAFIEGVVARWTTLTNPLTGQPLRARPHFAKEWPRKIRGLKIADYLKQEYRNAAPEFRQQMGNVSAQGGYKLEDAFGLFGNDAILDFVQSN